MLESTFIFVTVFIIIFTFAILSFIAKLTKKRTKELEEQYKIFETLFEKTSDGVLILEEHKFTRCNEAIVKMLGYTSKEEVLNLHPSKLSPEFQPDGQSSFDKAEKMMKKAVVLGCHQFEWVHLRANGKEFWASIRLTPIKLNDKEVLHVSWQDISKAKKNERQLELEKQKLYKLAHYDKLTGATNRVLFNDKVKHLIRKAKRKKCKFAVMFIDLDYFKKVNDEQGHDVGDIVLKQVANRILKLIRSNDTLTRLGGDEFAVIIEEIKDKQDAAILAEQIIKSVAKPYHVKEHDNIISNSIGISIYPDDATDLVTLLKHSDMAMYKAKDEGRGNYQFYDSLED